MFVYNNVYAYAANTMFVIMLHHWRTCGRLHAPSPLTHADPIDFYAVSRLFFVMFFSVGDLDRGGGGGGHPLA